MSSGTFRIAGHEHTYERDSGSCIWCGTHKQDGGEIACVRKRGKKKSNGSAAFALPPGGSKPMSKQKPKKVKGEAPASTGKATTGRCFESHKPLLIAEGLPEVRGGSCSTPIVDDCDVYIGFERSMKQTYRSFPWKQGDEFLYYIPDMAAPKDPVSFGKMIAWAHEQLKQGKKVHAGCIGGHGRTGTFLAALVFHVTGRKDAIAYVREHYCHKAVESKQQIEFLVKMGMDSAEPTKSFSSTSGGGWSGGYSDLGATEKWNKKWSGGGAYKSGMLSLEGGEEAIQPIASTASVWGRAIEDED